MMTGAGYRESLRDGRRVFFNGTKVADVTEHPRFAVGSRVRKANGPQRIDHVRDKIADMIMYATILRAGLEAASERGCSQGSIDDLR
jgi:aromatic ring hydroxylase